MESVSILNRAGTWYQKLGNMYRRLIVPKIVKNSAKIITVSKFERNRIADFFKIPKDDNKLVAIYNGVTNHFRKITDQNELVRVKKLYNLPEKFVLHKR